MVRRAGRTHERNPWQALAHHQVMSIGSGGKPLTQETDDI